MPSSSTERPPSEAQTVAAAYAYSAQHQARKGGRRDLRGVPDRCCPEGMCPEVGGTVMEEGPLPLTVNVLDRGRVASCLFWCVCTHDVCVCCGGGVLV